MNNAKKVVTPRSIRSTSEVMATDACAPTLKSVASSIEDINMRIANQKDWLLNIRDILGDVGNRAYGYMPESDGSDEMPYHGEGAIADVQTQLDKMESVIREVQYNLDRIRNIV